MKKLIICLLLGIVLSPACRKSPDTSRLSTEFVVQTAGDPDADFGSYNTYYISDTIKLSTTNPNDSIWSDLQSKQLIDAVKANMTARGYTLVGKGNNPDLGVSMSAIKDLNLGVIYPGWWWGYWGCYWGWCYYPPYYPWYGMLYTIPTGTLILDMVDLKNANADQRLTIVWGAVMSGGLGNTGNDLALGVSSIDQAFAQSGYLITN